MDKKSYQPNTALINNLTCYVSLDYMTRNWIIFNHENRILTNLLNLLNIWFASRSGSPLSGQNIRAFTRSVHQTRLDLTNIISDLDGDFNFPTMAIIRCHGFDRVDWLVGLYSVGWTGAVIFFVFKLFCIFSNFL